MVAGRLDPPRQAGRRQKPQSRASRNCLTMAAALVEIRGAKSKAKVSMKTEISLAKVYGPASALSRLQLVESDLRAEG